MVNDPRYIPIPHMNCKLPGVLGATKVIVCEEPSGTIFWIPSLGIVNDCVQPRPVVLTKCKVTCAPAFRVIFRGLYPLFSIEIVASWTGLAAMLAEFELSQKLIIVQLTSDHKFSSVKLLPAKAAALFILKTASTMTEMAATFMNFC